MKQKELLQLARIAEPIGMSLEQNRLAKLLAEKKLRLNTRYGQTVPVAEILRSLMAKIEAATIQKDAAIAAHFRHDIIRALVELVWGFKRGNEWIGLREAAYATKVLATVVAEEPQRYVPQIEVWLDLQRKLHLGNKWLLPLFEVIEDAITPAEVPVQRQMEFA